MRCLQDLLWDLQCLPPLVLPSGCGTLAEKFRISIFGAFLLAGQSRESLSKFCSSCRIATGDMGVEFGIPRVKPMPCSQVLPWMEVDCPPCSAASEADEWDIVVDPQDLDPEVGYDGCLANPGLMHIIHNAGGDLLASVPVLDAAVTQLSAVAIMLDKRATRRRILETCYDSRVGKTFHAEVNKWSGRIHRKRWGTVASCVEQLFGGMA